MKQSANTAAIYLRISRDDGGDAESNSIGNQREMLRRYAKDNGMAIYSEYVDDGISGTTFDRDSFKRMINDVEEGKVSIVLCKDLSRLGRHNAMVSYYTEILFPQNDIRFIALNDGIDTLYGENEIMGFKSIINEYYSRDISRKIRSSFKVRAQKGDFIGSYPPYGYIKNPENKHHLLVDEYSAGVVRRMFALSAEGTPAKTIANTLAKDGILIPMAYLHQRTGKWGSAFNAEYPANWAAYTVQSILKNRVYMGHMVGCKQTIKSFKNKKLENVPEENWITVRDTHEAIVDEKTFWHVQGLLSIKRPANVRTMENIFVGKLRCPDCGKNLGFQSVQGRHKYGSFVCNQHRRNAKFCTSHYIRYDALYDVVLSEIRRQADLANRYKGDLEEYLRLLHKNKTDAQESGCRKELGKAKLRSDELDTIIKRLFEQNALGVIPDDRFATLFGEYTAEQKGLHTKIDSLNAQLDKQRSDAESAEQFFDLILKHTNIEKLTTQTITDLIDHIVIYEHTGKGKAWRQKVDINYRFGGMAEIQT